MQTYEEWQQLYSIAKDNMLLAKDKTGCLIEVAAQHPLVYGMYPNEEFKKRLELALELYRNNTAVKLYVPGSLHVGDNVTLSEAGVTWLHEHGIPMEDLIGDKANITYTGEDGVYNSIDECYVTSRLFFDNKFKELHCVCSPAQLMRKALAYIQCGVVPNFHTVSVDDMFHNYINEAFYFIPDLLNDQTLSRDTRVERKPKRD